MSQEGGGGPRGKPMDPARFNRMRAAFEKHGGEIDMSEEAVFEMWQNDPEALAETLGSKYIRMLPKPDAATVFEEFIHTAQIRSGEYAKALAEFGEDLGHTKLEIVAQRKLLKNAVKWGLTGREVGRIQVRLEGLLASEKDSKAN